MAEKGLYKKHSLDHPLLKGFATYLEKDLLNENFKQEVRILFYYISVFASKQKNKCLLVICVVM